MPKRSWYERNEIKRINKDWVSTNVRLTEREEELLDIINKRKLVRRDMLEVISSSYRFLGANRTRIMNRSINKMFNSMVIDKVHEPQHFMKGNKPAVVALDKAGSVILGIPHKQRIKHHKSVVEGVEYIQRQLPSNYKHINGVNQLEVETILFCEESDNELIEWVLEKPIELFYGNEKIVLIPDVQMEIKLSGRVLNAFLEYDTSTENIRYKESPIIRDKIIKYKKYKLSNLWKESLNSYPLLILVTEDSKRIDFFNSKCEENGIAGIGVHVDNYRKFLEHISDKY